MAFGINRIELQAWKSAVNKGQIAFITHYWIHPRFPESKTVTKVGCQNINKLVNWGEKYGLKKEWMHNREEFPHFDLIGKRQCSILKQEGLEEHIRRFNMECD